MEIQFPIANRVYSWTSCHFFNKLKVLQSLSLFFLGGQNFIIWWVSIRPNELHIGNQMNEFAYCHHISMTWTRFGAICLMVGLDLVMAWKMKLDRLMPQTFSFITFICICSSCKVPMWVHKNNFHPCLDSRHFVFAFHYGTSTQW